MQNLFRNRDVFVTSRDDAELPIFSSDKHSTGFQSENPKAQKPGFSTGFEHVATREAKTPTHHLRVITVLWRKISPLGPQSKGEFPCIFAHYILENSVGGVHMFS